MTIGRLHLITPDTADPAVLDVTRTVLAAGVPVVQVRRKSGTDRERLAQLRSYVDACTSVGATCVVDDRVDLALAAGAAGVHVGADDLPVTEARRLLGPGAVVGGTCRDAEDARRAEAEGATYVGVGPVYASSTKVGLPEPMGPAGIERIAAAVSIPVIAISGITLERVPELLDAGVHGVAVVAAIYGAPDPVAAASGFLAALTAADGVEVGA